MTPYVRREDPQVTPTKFLPSEGLLERVRMPSTDHKLADGIAPPLSIKEKVKKLRISSDHTCLLSFFFTEQVQHP